MNSKDISPAIEVAKERLDDLSKIITMSTGIRAKLHGVSATLMDEVSSRIPDPQPPTIYLEDKGRAEENPNDPKYLAELDRVNKNRGIAALDAMVMFGVELVDPLPEDSTWIPKLKYLEKRGLLDLSSFDLIDPLDKEFVFKRYIAVGSEDLDLIGSAIAPDKVAKAEASFPGDEGKRTDKEHTS